MECDQNFPSLPFLTLTPSLGLHGDPVTLISLVILTPSPYCHGDHLFIIMVNAGAGQVWVMENGLGTARAVEFLDLPADQSVMVESFLDRTRAERNPLKLAFLRWKLQVQLLKVTPSQCIT